MSNQPEAKFVFMDGEPFSDQSIDDMVYQNVDVHVERLDNDSYYISIMDADRVKELPVLLSFGIPHRPRRRCKCTVELVRYQ